jgi:hypothetical protein
MNTYRAGTTVKIWLDNELHDGDPAWEGTVEDLGAAVPFAGDTLSLPGLHPAQNGVAVVTHRHFEFVALRTRELPAHALEHIAIDARSEA